MKWRRGAILPKSPPRPIFRPIAALACTNSTISMRVELERICLVRKVAFLYIPTSSVHRSQGRKIMKLAFNSAGILSCNILLVLGSVASAAEPAQSGIPILLKIPYVNRLFKNTAPALHCQEASEAASAKLVPRQFRIVGSDGLERIGIDFDCQVVGATGPCCEEECIATRCQEGCAATKCLGEKATCVEDCDAECVSQVTVSESRQLLNREAFHEREVELLGELFEARLEAAIAQAKLEAQDAAVAKEAKLQKKLAAAKLANANLQAKLELAAEKEKLAAELHQAQLELVVLKAKNGTADAKQAGRTTTETTLSPVERR